MMPGRSPRLVHVYRARKSDPSIAARRRHRNVDAVAGCHPDGVAAAAVDAADARYVAGRSPARLFTEALAAGSWDSATKGDACVVSCFLLELPRPTARIATSDGTTLRRLRRRLLPLRGPLPTRGRNRTLSVPVRDAFQAL